jgi:hypothetical protein
MSNQKVRKFWSSTTCYTNFLNQVCIFAAMVFNDTPAVRSVHASINSTRFASNEEIVDWDVTTLKAVVRTTVYANVKIIFNSKRELKYGSKICDLVLRSMEVDNAWKHRRNLTDDDKSMLQQQAWATLSPHVSRNIDQKRHNQKPAMRVEFWGK